MPPKDISGKCWKVHSIILPYQYTQQHNSLMMTSSQLRDSTYLPIKCEDHQQLIPQPLFTSTTNPFPGNSNSYTMYSERVVVCYGVGDRTTGLYKNNGVDRHFRLVCPIAECPSTTPNLLHLNTVALVWVFAQNVKIWISRWGNWVMNYADTAEHCFSSKTIDFFA